jgi:phage shock protein PspC (stress-responsive transcriptional regulator)
VPRPSYDAEWRSQGSALLDDIEVLIMNDIRQAFARHGLVRARDRRVLGGVAAGLGRRLGLEPWTARILFVLLLLVLPGSQLLVYPILWILMPSEESSEARVQNAAPTPAA